MTLKDFIKKLQELIPQVDEFHPDEDKEGADLIVGIRDHDEQSTFLLGHGCAKCMLEYFNASEEIKHNGQHGQDVVH